jgi:hypothetical protein
MRSPHPFVTDHDWFPVYDLPGDSDPFYTNVSDLWASYGWLTPQQQATFALGGYYWVRFHCSPFITAGG